MMRGPEHVLQKAQTRYRGIWRDALLGADSGAYAVTLDPPSASAITARAADVSAWLIRWRQWAAQHPGVTLRDKKIRTKFGDQPVYTHLDIPDTLTLASLNTDTAAHWQRARDRWDQLSRHHPGQAVQPWLARIVDLDDYDFTILLAATTWFGANPRSGLTVRSVPVPGMHTKWLARHRSMVIACLGTPTDPGESAEPPEDPDPADIPDGDLDALGLRPLPREISIVIADPVLRAATGGLRQITAPVNELATLQIQPDTILIVENKEPAVTWSDTAGLVVIHSPGQPPRRPQPPALDLPRQLLVLGRPRPARLYSPLPRPHHDPAARITAHDARRHRDLPAAGRRGKTRPVQPARLDADPAGSPRARCSPAHRRKVSAHRTRANSRHRR